MHSTQPPLAFLLILLAALTALAPFGTDAYLPAIPTMANEFNASIHHVELSLSLFLAGFSLGQLIGGPISDHLGRRKTIFIGLSIFAVGSLGVMLSHSLAQLITFRVLEAMGGGLAIVNAGAIIRDISSGTQSAKNLSHMALIMMLAPLLAPMIGSTLLHIWNWHSIFSFLLIYSLVLLLLIHRYIPETKQHHPHKISTLERYLMILRNKHALSYIASLCFAYGGMFTFITASPSVYMGYFGVSESIYPFLFGANIVTMILFNRLNIALLHRHPPQALLTLGQLIQLVTALILFAYVTYVDTLSLTVTVGLIMIFIGAQSFVVSNANACTVEFFPTNSGTATALLGAAGFGTGALAGTLVGLFGDGTPMPMVTIMLLAILLGLTFRYLFFRFIDKTQ